MTTNGVLLSTALPGLPLAVADAWLRCETSPGPWHATNPLNIRYYGRTGQIGQLGGSGIGQGFAVYASAADGLRDAAALILHSSYYAGVRAALAAGDPYRIAVAIERSPWAAGNYGGHADASGTWVPGCIARQIGPEGPVMHSTPSLIDPGRVAPLGYVSVKPCTVYADPDRHAVLIAKYGGAPRVGIYGTAAGTDPLGAPLVPVRIDLAGGDDDLRIGWVGSDVIGPITPA